MNDQRQSPVSEGAEPADDRHERMQRIRVGLTGLAVVLLLVFVATFAISRLQGPVANNSIAAESGDEPLAELGVAPGASEDNQSVPAPPK
jgi:hypothetical protein